VPASRSTSCDEPEVHACWTHDPRRHARSRVARWGDPGPRTGYLAGGRRCGRARRQRGPAARLPAHRHRHHVRQRGRGRASSCHGRHRPRRRLRHHEKETLTESLAALHVDHLDLWLIHWPPGGGAAPRTWDVFRSARDEGLVRSIGVSNYSITQIDELIRATGEAPAVNQIPYSPSDHDPELLAAHRERGVVVEGYSPLKRSNLRAPALVDAAAAHDVTPAQVVLRWHVQHEVVVIPKSTAPERIAANLDVFAFELTSEEMSRIDAMS